MLESHLQWAYNLKRNKHGCIGEMNYETPEAFVYRRLISLGFEGIPAYYT
jgi:hypothetical protein